MPAHHIHHLRFDIGNLLVILHISEELATKVRSEDDQRIAEINLSALPIGQMSIVKNLQQHVEDVCVRFLDLVKQHNLIGAAAHRFG